MISLVRVVLIVAAAGLAACAGGGAGDGNGDNPDAGANGCQISVLLPALGEATVGASVELQAVIDGGGFGAGNFEWSISFDGVEQEYAALSTNPTDRVALTPQSVGIYDIFVSAVDAGEDCFPAAVSLNVVEAGAIRLDALIRVRSGQAPPVEKLIALYGGTGEQAIPDIELSAGAAITGAVYDAEGAPVSSYVRATRRGSDPEEVYEFFSDAAGAYQSSLPMGRYDVLIVPSASAQPGYLLRDRSLESLGNGTPAVLTLPTAETLSGRVLDSAGQGIEGARVRLEIDGAPSATGLSGSDGSFALSGYTGSLTGLSLVPPAGSGLPTLRAEDLSGQSLGAGQELALRFSVDTTDASVQLSGAGTSGALAEFRGELSSVGTFRIGSGTTQSIGGTVRIASTASATGLVTARVPASTTDIVVLGTASAAAIRRNIDWQGAPISALSLSTPVVHEVQLSAVGVPAAGARATAFPQTLLAPQAPVVLATADAEGHLSLPLVAGGDYLVRIDAGAGRVASYLVEDASAEQRSIDLPAVLRLVGRVVLGGAAVAGAQVDVRCLACDESEIMGTATTRLTGKFLLAVPDPGVTSP